MLINVEFASVHSSLSDVSLALSKPPASKLRSTGASRYKLSLDSPFVGGLPQGKKIWSSINSRGQHMSDSDKEAIQVATTKVNIFRCRNFSKGNVGEV